MLTRHLFLTKNQSLAEAGARVMAFLEKTQLVRYDSVDICVTDSCNAESSEFWPNLRLALGKNEEQITEHARILTEELNITRVADLVKIQRGYESKVLHILAHFLDGFIGIDSAFYNLEEDSHCVSNQMAEAIAASPSLFWLVSATGTNWPATKKPDRLTDLRKGS